ncbi:MAG: hypothetical protein ABEJ87_02705 [Candidatus Nanohalobium sp.]
MKRSSKIKLVFGFEALSLIGIVAGIYFLEADVAEAYGLEFLGADLAAMITTFGLLKMRELT